MIDLAANRTIAIHDRKHNYTFTLAPIAAAQWLKYFDAVVSTSEQDGANLVRTFDNSKARLDLVDSALISVFGYAGSTPIEQLADWKSLLPLSHRIAVANVLLNVKATEGDDSQAITLGLETVCLQALWSSDDAGGMPQHNLVHQFKTPTWEHQRRFQRAAARPRIVGGSRSGKTVWLGAQRELVDIYDELIEEVGGYEFNGVNLTGASIEVVRYMDTYHKVTAAEQLFTPAQVGDGEALEAA